MSELEDERWEQKNHSRPKRLCSSELRAAREVQAASTALKSHFAADGGPQPSTLELARFAAAMQELKDAREAFDRLIVGDTDR